MNNDAPIVVQGIDAKTAIFGAICFTIFGGILCGGVVWTYLLRAPMPSHLPRLLVTWQRRATRSIAVADCVRCGVDAGTLHELSCTARCGRCGNGVNAHRSACAARATVNVAGRAPKTWLGWAVLAWIAVRETSRHAGRKVRQVRDNSVAREIANSDDSTVPVRQLRRPSPRPSRHV